jgi:predicted porin
MSGFNAALTFIPGQSVGQNLNGAKVRGSNSSANAVAVSNVASSHGKNSYGIKLNYAGAGVTASLTYFDVAAQINATSSATLKPLSLAGSYDFGNGMVTAQYVKADTTVGATRIDATKYYNLGGKFNVSGNSAIKAQYSHASDDGTAGATNGAKMWAVGYDYNFSKRTGMYVVYAATSNDATGMFTMSGWGNQGQVNGVTNAGDDPHGLGIGLTHSF